MARQPRRPRQGPAQRIVCRTAVSSRLVAVSWGRPWGKLVLGATGHRASDVTSARGREKDGAGFGGRSRAEAPWRRGPMVVRTCTARVLAPAPGVECDGIRPPIETHQQLRHPAKTRGSTLHTRDQRRVRRTSLLFYGRQWLILVFPVSSTALRADMSNAQRVCPGATLSPGAHCTGRVGFHAPARASMGRTWGSHRYHGVRRGQGHRAHVAGGSGSGALVSRQVSRSEGLGEHGTALRSS